MGDVDERGEEHQHQHQHQNHQQGKIFFFSQSLYIRLALMSSLYKASCEIEAFISLRLVVGLTD